MESTEFDSTLGGTEKLPFSINSLKFAASRSVEIAAMTESILRPSKTKLVFQSLPVHMRRRVMSHNAKRLPRRFRQAHLEQLRKSGLPPKQKRPSRKHRRRPANLRQEYNRRQKQDIWLETHIWHAKRFHMTKRWGHHLALAPCDKAYRAGYRASSAHCLMQDISYYIPFQIKGTIDGIKELFKTITSSSCGLSVAAKAYTTGNREGEIHLYEPNSYPLNFIGKVQYLYEPSSNGMRTLWLFVHPAYSKQVESTLTDLLSSIEKNEDMGAGGKKRKVANTQSESIQFKVLPTAFNRFRFTGPNSQAILVRSLKCVEDLETIKNNHWVEQHMKFNSELYLKEKKDYWTSIDTISSPSQLPPRIIVGLIVKDPRLMRPSHRTKAKAEVNPVLNRDILGNIPPKTSNSPIWDTDICKTIKNKTMTNGQFIQHVTKLNLVPGVIFEDDPEMQSIPIVLIQRPGSQDSRYKKTGYGSGWDIIVPSGYSMPFWLTFIMFGARTGGLRDTESLAFEMGECYLPPDSEAGAQNEKRIEWELKDRYFRLAPSKRVNYVKLGINSPFICPWKILLKDWSEMQVNEFYVLRDWRILDELQECIKRKKQLPEVNNPHSCLVALYLHVPVGSLKRHALISLPQHGDIANVKTLYEDQHEDPNENLRRSRKREHLATLRKLRRTSLKLKKKQAKLKEFTVKPRKKKTNEPSRYVKLMRELWVPSNIKTVRNVCSRETMGYVSQGAFSFTEAHSCGLGYVSYMALNNLLKSGLNQVLVRNTSAKKYRLAKIEIIKNV